MSGETPLKPESMERLANSYANLIKAGEKTLENVPSKPATLKPRVEYLVTREPNTLEK